MYEFTYKKEAVANKDRRLTLWIEDNLMDLKASLNFSNVISLGFMRV